MPAYVTDTHPLIWHLTQDHAKLSPLARRIFEETDRGLHTVWIPSIVLVEVVYISEKKNILPHGGSSFLTRLAGATNFRIDPLDLPTVSAMQVIPRAKITGMPDRIIAATSLKLGLPLITADPQITTSGLVPVAW